MTISVINEDLIEEGILLGLTSDEAWDVMRSYSDRQLMSDDIPGDFGVRVAECISDRRAQAPTTFELRQD